MKKYYLFFLILLNILNASISNASISNLSQKTIEKLNQYNLNSKACDDILKNLVEINVKYYDFEGNIKNDGLIIVHFAVSANVVNIFNELFKIKFPIGGIDPFKGGVLVEGKFIPDNNYNYAGSFFCRNIALGSTPSVHGFGMAIDINPLYNPFIEVKIKEKSLGEIIPKDGIFYINREKTIKGKITPEIVKIFEKNGFNIWGGVWTAPLDYHHFQVSKKLAILISAMNKDDGRRFFELHTEFYNQKKEELIDRYLKHYNLKKSEDLILEYKKNPERFFFVEKEM